MGLILYSGNLIDSATFTPTNSNALFPATNLKDPRRSKVFRSTTNTDSIVIDFQETSEIDSIFLVDEPRNGFGINSLGFAFNATSDFTSPAYSDTLTFSTAHGVGYKSFTQQDYRFCKLSLTSTLGYCELSKIFIGKKIDIGRGPNFGWSYQDKELSTTKENRYGQRFTDVISRQKVINVSLTLLSKTQLDMLLALYDNKGSTKPFYMAIDCDNIVDDKRRFSGMVYLNSVPTITNTSFSRYSMSLQFEEAL